jgi:hypothetical protein
MRRSSPRRPGVLILQTRRSRAHCPPRAASPRPFVPELRQPLPSSVFIAPNRLACDGRSRQGTSSASANLYTSMPSSSTRSAFPSMIHSAVMTSVLHLAGPPFARPQPSEGVSHEAERFSGRGHACSSGAWCSYFDDRASTSCVPLCLKGPPRRSDTCSGRKVHPLSRARRGRHRRDAVELHDNPPDA